MSATILTFRRPRPELEDGWRAFAQWCCLHPEFLRTEREADFVAAMTTWPCDPSERQLQWLAAISRRCERAATERDPRCP